MFVGLPLLLAIGFSFTPPAKTITGGIMRGITFADRRRVQREMNKLRCTVLVVIGFMAMEGVVPGFDANKSRGDERF